MKRKLRKEADLKEERVRRRRRGRASMRVTREEEKAGEQGEQKRGHGEPRDAARKKEMPKKLGRKRDREARERKTKEERTTLALS